MSICLGDSTTPVNLTAAQAFILPAVAIPVAVVIAWLCGAFRRDSVVGPIRLNGRDASTGLLWMITLIGFFAWMMVPAILVGIAHGELFATPSTPSAGKIVALSAAEQVELAALAPLVGFVTLLGLDATAMKRRNGEPGLIERLGLAKSRAAKGFAIASLGSLVAIPLTLSMSNLSQWAFEQLHAGQTKDHALIQIFTDPNSRALRLEIAISAVLLAPLFEELIFRGHLQTAIAGTAQLLFDSARSNSIEPANPSAAARWAAIVIAAAVFAAVHEGGWMRPPLFVFAVCIGYVYERTGNLWAAIAMHAIFNAFSISEVMIAR